MTKLKHPDNKFQRKIAEEKHTLDEKKAKERSGRIRRRLFKESLKAKETEDELREFVQAAVLSDDRDIRL